MKASKAQKPSRADLRLLRRVGVDGRGVTWKELEEFDDLAKRRLVKQSVLILDRRMFPPVVELTRAGRAALASAKA